MVRNWIIKEQGDTSKVDKLAELLGIDKATSNLLIQRGIDSFEKAKNFFRPELEDLFDPYLMKDMDKAVDRLQTAIKNKEKILVYGDYDVDGTTSVAMMHSFLKKHNQNILFYIPDRYSEGYGISVKGIDFAATEGVQLIVALDCGIKAMEKINHAKKHGIDFIICDHHTAGDTIPDAVAVLDPKRPDCQYPYKELSGCGVGFKLIHAYCIKENISFENITEYLDLLVISIASDIVPITGENRILAYHGLKQLNSNPRNGIKAILKVSGIENKTIDISDIVFKIGPRINAAGRIEFGKSAVELLISESDSIANNMGENINDFNKTRRNIDTNITKEAIQQIENNRYNEKLKCNVVFNPEWHKGVVGIVASRLTEHYYKPAIVLTESNDLVTGSARSVPGFDLYKAIESCSSLLENFGGHMYAAGLTMKKDNFAKFKKQFEKYVDDNIQKEQLIPVTEIDSVINLCDITPKFYRILKQFEPFGPENLAPVFLTENVSNSGSGKLVGNEKEHLKLDLLQEDDPFKTYPAIGFNLGKFFEKISNGKAFDICYHIEENYYMGKSNLQLRIKDIKIDS